MKKLFLLTLLVLSACAKSKDPVERGRAYFVGLGCITCHRVGEKGGGQAGPDLTTVGLRKSAEWLDLWLKNPQAWKPGSSMPNFKLKDNVRADLVAYMGSLQGQLYREKTPWNEPELMANPVLRGERIFNRVGCVGCHGSHGEGGYPNNNVVGGKIPALTFTADGYSKEELKHLIQAGRKSLPADINQPAPMIAMPEWGKYLKDDEIEALVEYVFSLRPQTSGSDWSE